MEDLATPQSNQAKLKAEVTPSLQFKVGQLVRVQSPTTAAGRDQEGFVGKVERSACFEYPFHRLRKTCHQMLWERQKCLDEDLVLEGLPFPLRMDIAAQVNRGIVNAVPLFRDAHVSLQKRIALALRPQICPQNEHVYETGDIGFEIYFILYGKIMIIKSTDTSKLDFKSKRRQRKHSTQSVLIRGSHFGESTMGTLTGVRCESARAMDFCDLYILTKPKLENILSVLHGQERLGFIAQLKKMKGSNQHKAVVEFAAPIPGFDRGSLKGESFMYRTCSWSNMAAAVNRRNFSKDIVGDSGNDSENDEVGRNDADS